MLYLLNCMHLFLPLHP